MNFHTTDGSMKDGTGTARVICVCACVSGSVQVRVRGRPPDSVIAASPVCSTHVPLMIALPFLCTQAQKVLSCPTASTYTSVYVSITSAWAFLAPRSGPTVPEVPVGLCHSCPPWTFLGTHTLAGPTSHSPPFSRRLFLVNYLCTNCRPRGCFQGTHTRHKTTLHPTFFLWRYLLWLLFF